MNNINFKSLYWILHNSNGKGRTWGHHRATVRLETKKVLIFKQISTGAHLNLNKPFDIQINGQRKYSV